MKKIDWINGYKPGNKKEKYEITLDQERLQFQKLKLVCFVRKVAHLKSLDL